MNKLPVTSNGMRDPACLFCKIAAGELPATRVFEDDELLAFPDIHPKAPVHLLIIPKDHVMRSVADMTADQEGLLGRMLWRAKLLAEEQGIAENGYRLVFNNRHHGGQEVDHVHLHLLGGQPLGSMA